VHKIALDGVFDTIKRRWSLGLDRKVTASHFGNLPTIEDIVGMVWFQVL
jgi:hypothetical protein